MSQREHHNIFFVMNNLSNRVVAVSALGYFINAYNLVVFSIVRVSSLHSLGVPDTESFNVAQSLLSYQMWGLLVGGVIFGILGDKRGRLTSLFASILLCTAANLFNVFVTNIQQYRLLRLLAGFGLAGELGSGITMTVETSEVRKRTISTTVVTTVGLLAGVPASLLGMWLPWRICFGIGGLMGLPLLWLRRGLRESQLYREAKDTSSTMGSMLLIAGDRKRLMKYLLCIGIGAPTYYVYGLLITGAPEFGKEMRLHTLPIAGTAFVASYCGMALGNVCCSALSYNSMSRRRALATFNCVLLLAVAGFLYLPMRTSAEFYFRCGCLGFGCGYWALVMVNATEQFGTNIRATVATTVPNFIRWAYVPLAILFRYSRGSLNLIQSAALVGFIAGTLALISVALSRETFGRRLDFCEA